ncbi:MAG: hypothetical protein Q8M39_05175 [Sulfuricurvum sp.]|nr:hypothetical protein [Sulfuricurvum sp.]
MDEEKEEKLEAETIPPEEAEINPPIGEEGHKPFWLKTEKKPFVWDSGAGENPRTL